jgi:hypothetical protein
MLSELQNYKLFLYKVSLAMYEKLTNIVTYIITYNLPRLCQILGTQREIRASVPGSGGHALL